MPQENAQGTLVGRAGYKSLRGRHRCQGSDEIQLCNICPNIWPWLLNEWLNLWARKQWNTYFQDHFWHPWTVGDQWPYDHMGHHHIYIDSIMTAIPRQGMPRTYCSPNIQFQMYTGILDELRLKISWYIRYMGLPWWSVVKNPMQGIHVRSLLREDPTCQAATKPHNYWARALESVLRSHRNEEANAP